jgi:hypothetical protein
MKLLWIADFPATFLQFLFLWIPLLNLPSFTLCEGTAVLLYNSCPLTAILFIAQELNLHFPRLKIFADGLQFTKKHKNFILQKN